MGILKNMKLKDLRPYLRADKINLYLKVGFPIKFEIWGLDNETKAMAEYRSLDEVDRRENDTMFLDYGECLINEIGIEEDGVIYISIRLE